ncbi:MAG: hypothetical protein ABI597_10300 [Gammaproteobacteria bacterium]
MFNRVLEIIQTELKVAEEERAEVIENKLTILVTAINETIAAINSSPSEEPKNKKIAEQVEKLDLVKKGLESKEPNIDTLSLQAQKILQSLASLMLTMGTNSKPEDVASSVIGESTEFRIFKEAGNFNREVEEGGESEQMVIAGNARAKLEIKVKTLSILEEKELTSDHLNTLIQQKRDALIRHRQAVKADKTKDANIGPVSISEEQAVTIDVLSDIVKSQDTEKKPDIIVKGKIKEYKDLIEIINKFCNASQRHTQFLKAKAAIDKQITLLRNSFLTSSQNKRPLMKAQLVTMRTDTDKVKSAGAKKIIKVLDKLQSMIAKIIPDHELAYIDSIRFAGANYTNQDAQKFYDISGILDNIKRRFENVQNIIKEWLEFLLSEQALAPIKDKSNSDKSMNSGGFSREGLAIKKQELKDLVLALNKEIDVLKSQANEFEMLPKQASSRFSLSVKTDMTNTTPEKRLHSSSVSSRSSQSTPSTSGSTTPKKSGKDSPSTPSKSGLLSTFFRSGSMSSSRSSSTPTTPKSGKESPNTDSPIPPFSLSSIPEEQKFKTTLKKK